MKTEYNTTKWLRWLEMVAMVVTILGTSSPFFVMAVISLRSSGLNSNNYTNAIITLLTGIMLLFIVGIIFGSILKHYIYHQETRNDVMWARGSSILIFGDILIFYIVFLIA